MLKLHDLSACITKVNTNAYTAATCAYTVGVEKCMHLSILQIVLPVLYYIPGDQNHHSYENSLDALLMIKNDGKLLAMSGVENIELWVIKSKYIINK